MARSQWISDIDWAPRLSSTPSIVVRRGDLDEPWPPLPLIGHRPRMDTLRGLGEDDDFDTRATLTFIRYEEPPPPAQPVPRHRSVAPSPIPPPRAPMTSRPRFDALHDDVDPAIAASYRRDAEQLLRLDVFSQRPLARLGALLAGAVAALGRLFGALSAAFAR
jgi:hypothetical protein